MNPPGVGAKGAAEGSSGMAETLLERAWAWLHATFPERQIYVRSDGRVQFFTFGPTLQATLAGLSLIFLGWVAFASVNVIFKDRIISAKEHRYQQMQSTYENRVADLQVSYDELNGALVSAEDRFKSVADELQHKQSIVAKILHRKQTVDATLGTLGGNGGVRAALRSGDDDDDIPKTAADTDTASDSVDVGVTPGGSGDMQGAEPAPKNGSQLNVMPQNVEPQPRTGKPTKASFLDNALTKFASALFRFGKKPAGQADVPNQPALRVLAEQTQRVRRMSGAETALLEGVDKQITVRIDDLQALLTRVGVDPDALERKAEGAMGGPLVPIQSVHIQGIADQSFTDAYEGIGAHVDELDALFAVVRRVPLTTPVHGSQFEVTSGFGPRIDPFTHRVSFHPGIDFAGPWGSIVRSTAPGVVDWAGPRGGYGNLVEIDHGYGFKTRYGHLEAILVHVGERVTKGAPIGKLGSTGRSTGPHVHYEVWSADVVRNPRTFIEAGRHVFQQE
jgi:murein DD-endopeptidase MepM/ murein hydrolase activator NlpD